MKVLSTVMQKHREVPVDRSNALGKEENLDSY